MPQANMPIPFPLRGLDRRAGYQSLGAETTPHSLNVVPDDSRESRTRGGCRPGLTRRYPQSLGTDIAIMLPVSTPDTGDDQSYQYLAVGTESAIYVSSATRVGATYPVSFIESLNLIANIGISATRSQATAYKGSIVVASKPGQLFSGTADVAENQITSSDITDYSAIASSTHVVNILDGDHFGTYLIETVSSGSISIASDESVTVSGVEFEIVEASLLIDPQAGTVKRLSSKGGIVPVGATSVSVYRDRLVWVVDRAWYMSRQGDIQDYNYGADGEDGGRAVAGVNSTAGQPGDPIVAMAVGGDDYLVMFAEDTTWVLRGDPAYGGKLYNLSTVVGCVGSEAWCYGPTDEIYFLAKTGLYVIGSSVDDPPSPISDNVLPNELKRITSTNFTVSLAFDSSDSGIAVFLTPKDNSNGVHWWFDLQTSSFWPIQMSNSGQQPIAVCNFAGTPSRQQRLLLACKDGYLREFDGLLDDGEDIVSSIVLGPFSTTNDASLDGILTELRVILGRDENATTSVTVSLYSGSSAERLVDNAIQGTQPSSSFSITTAPSATLRERLRGTYFCVRIDGVGPWAYEEIVATVSPTGRHRLVP